MKEFLPKALTYLKNHKVQIVCIVFVIWIIWFSGTSFYSQHQREKEIEALKQAIELLNKQTKENHDLVEQLKSNPDVQEKFGRENYIIHRPDEDVFLVEFEEGNASPTAEEN